MSEQEKKRQRIYDLHKANHRFFVVSLQSKGKHLQKKSFKKDSATSLRKHANELKVNEKTVWTTIIP